MTPAQKDKIHLLVVQIHSTAIACGFFIGDGDDPQAEMENQTRSEDAWSEFNQYLASIVAPEEGLLEGESIRCSKGIQNKRGEK